MHKEDHELDGCEMDLLEGESQEQMLTVMCWTEVVTCLQLFWTPPQNMKFKSQLEGHYVSVHMIGTGMR